MSEIGRFGVFLPSFIWAGDGPERARGISTLRKARTRQRASSPFRLPP